MSYSSEVLADSPLVYWRLGDSSGTTATDSSGHSRNGAYQNGPTLGATGLLTSDADTAMQASANSGQAAKIASASWMDSLSAFTVEILVNLTSATDVSNGDAIASRYGAGGFQWLLWRNTSGQLAIQSRDSGGTFFNVASGSTMSLSTTYHVAATWNGSTLTLYVNGVSVGTPASMGSLAASSEDMWVAVYSQAAATTPAGTFDEFAFYGTALSSGRISAHYTAATTASPDATVLPPAATATAAALAPAVTGSRNATVLPPAATASATALVPMVSAGGNVTVFAVPATATATARPPVWTQLLDVATDTTNALDGLSLVGVATVTVTRAPATAPATLVLADKYDKAVPYPPPTMVNGRPT